MTTAQPSTRPNPNLRIDPAQLRDAAHRRVRRVTFSVVALTIGAAAVGALALGTPKDPSPVAPISLVQTAAGRTGTPR